MHVARFSGILTVGVVAFGVLWYFNSRPSGDASADHPAPVTDQALPPEVTANQDASTIEFRPRGSQILVLDREGWTAEALQNGAWNPVFNLDGFGEATGIPELHNHAADFGGLIVQAGHHSVTEDVALFSSLAGGTGPTAPIRLTSSPSSSSSTLETG